MNNTIPFELVEDAIRYGDIGFNEDVEDIIREDYSGRGMYGRECFGLVVDELSQVVQLLVNLAVEGAREDSDARIIEDVESLARCMRTDNMGLSTIVYFPGWSLER